MNDTYRGEEETYLLKQNTMTIVIMNLSANEIVNRGFPCQSKRIV